ncbi:MAG: hypothetical protein ACTHMM_15810 [Agriterribacter sp.]
MFASLFKLFGCSGQPKQNEKAPKPDTLNQQINQSIEDFKNRPIHKVLTTKIIDTTSDDELLQTVFDNLIEKFPDDYTKEYQTVLSWTKPSKRFI